LTPDAHRVAVQIDGHRSHEVELVV